MKPAKFRKKPVVIEAMQLTARSREDVSCWVNGGPSGSDITQGLKAWFYESNGDGELYIETLEGVMKATEGDFIIKGVKGEFYPCKPDIFAATYDLESTYEIELPPFIEPPAERGTMEIIDSIWRDINAGYPQKP